MTKLNRLLWYGGDWHDSIDGELIDIKNPATGHAIGRTAVAGPRDIEKGVLAAENVKREWAAMHPDERARIIHSAADKIAENIDEIARVLTLEQGKPLCDSQKEILFGVRVLHYYAEEGKRIFGSLRPGSSQDIRNIVQYQPSGIAAAIVPWNYPVDIYCWKIGPALAAGCPVIAKPPHEAPLAVGMVSQHFHSAGLPPGVLNDLPGTGNVAGAALASHPGIAVVSATGSVSTGQHVMEAASKNIKRVSLELGGHSPFIVLADADIEEAARAAMRRSFSNMGQICVAVNRILVERPIYKIFVECLATLSDEIELGNGLQDGVAYGPVLNESVIERTRAHIGDALEKGGRLVAGNKELSMDLPKDGYFFRPSLVADAPLDSLVMTEETFGPLAGIRSFNRLDDLLETANGLPYGLAAYLYSTDLEKAWSIADQLEFGAVGINVNDTSELQAPFGGWKLSGVGRELGPDALAVYLEAKHIKIRIRDAIIKENVIKP